MGGKIRRNVGKIRERFEKNLNENCGFWAVVVQNRYYLYQDEINLSVNKPLPR